MQRNLFVVMRIRSPVVLSYLHASFEPRCACMVTAMVPKRGRKTAHFHLKMDHCVSRLELGPSWVVILRNALEITVEERLLAFKMCLHGQDDRPETRLKNGSFPPQNGPPRGTTAWYTPY